MGVKRRTNILAKIWAGTCRWKFQLGGSTWKGRIGSYWNIVLSLDCQIAESSLFARLFGSFRRITDLGNILENHFRK